MACLEGAEEAEDEADANREAERERAGPPHLGERRLGHDCDAALPEGGAQRLAHGAAHWARDHDRGAGGRHDDTHAPVERRHDDARRDDDAVPSEEDGGLLQVTTSQRRR